MIIGTMLVFISYWVAAEALFPALVARTRALYQRPFKLTILGLVLAAPLIALGIFVMNLPSAPVKIIGGLILSIPVIAGLAGSSGLCQKVGLGLPMPLDDQQPWRRVLRGGTVLTVTFLLPFVGWFFILPWTLVTGFAAAVLAVLPERKTSTPQPVAEAAPVSTPKEVLG
ncbi:MAG: hypothetical protein HZA89_12920 [Verrucomicrobia bacterium]|nr:hypothetical protein [Verrucomicrobiota bacterium]